MTAADVPVMLGGQLPPVLWHPRATAPEYQPGLFQPPGPPGVGSGTCKPTGGLWTSPPTDFHGTTISAFEQWQRHGWGAPSETWLPPRQVTAHPLAAIAVIHEPHHWDALYRAYPWKVPFEHPLREVWEYLRMEQLDWTALAASGTVQAIGLTDDAAGGWTSTSLTSLDGWGMTTVFWLDPDAYTVA